MNKSVLYSLIKPNIIFESIPDFSDNTMPVYEEMLRRGMDRKYRLTWYLSYDRCMTMNHGVAEYWNPRDRKTIRDRIRNYSFFYKTKCIICCNRFLTSHGDDERTITFGKDQVSFYLTHGTPMKSVKDYYTCPEGIDYVLSAAPGLNALMAYEFSVPQDKVFAAGFPRNDVFSKPAVDIKSAFGKQYDKIIIWYPTYRQNNTGPIRLQVDSLPIIHDKQNAIRLNEAAKKSKCLIVLKPHFAQDTSMIRDDKLSNIRLIDDAFFKQAGFSSYEMLAASDALITDYSSLYYDYTLRDKPIGAVWEDIDSYSKKPGFAVDLDYYLNGAVKIYNIAELCDFVKAVSEGKDSLRSERREIRDAVNFSTDGNNARRVVDFIIDKARL
jgi:CDP-glycerol glycerophosphotransferase (TagB/SpsB family)